MRCKSRSLGGAGTGWPCTRANLAGLRLPSSFCGFSAQSKASAALQALAARSRRWPDASGRCTGLTADPVANGARVRDHRPIGKLESRQFLCSGGGPQRIARPLAKERNRAAVRGDHLVVLDPRIAQRLLDATTWMDPRPTVVTVTDVQRRLRRPRLTCRFAFRDSTHTLSATRSGTRETGPSGAAILPIAETRSPTSRDRPASAIAEVFQGRGPARLREAPYRQIVRRLVRAASRGSGPRS
jgi:hypothetical protein